MSDDTPRGEALAALRSMLAERHGITDKSGGWVSTRLDAALDELAQELGSVRGAVDSVRLDPARLNGLAELLRVGETRFYRDPEQWEALARVARERWLPRGRVRALSVGCSTGQEAFTLAMVLDEARRAVAEASLRVVGMDKSEAAISTARAGAYALDALETLPVRYRERYFATVGEGRAAVDGLQNVVSFSVRDALAGPPPGRWELSICKNVLIYLSDAAAERVVASLLRGLSDDGVLLVARSEVARVRALGHAAEELAPGVTVFRPE